MKNFESHTTSLLRGVPFSQVQSAYAKGSVGFGFSGEPARASCDRPAVAPDGMVPTALASGVAADTEAAAVAGPATSVGVVGLRLLIPLQAVRYVPS